MYSNFILYFNEKIKIIENSHNFVNRGIFFSLKGDYDNALADLNKAIERKEQNGIAYFTRANSRLKMLEQIEALPVPGETYSVGLTKTSNYQKASDEGMISNSEYESILDDYGLTLYLNPRFFFGYYNRAYVKLKMKNYYGAMEDLNKAIELEPEFAEAYFNRGLTKIYQDDLEGGAMDLSRAGELGIHGAYNIIKRYCNL